MFARIRSPSADFAFGIFAAGEEGRAYLLKGGTPMDFIERVFHVSPDGGSGTLELLLVLVPVLVVLALTAARLSRRFIARR